MPRQVHMTWVSNEARWKKMYKGKRYIVSCRELGTEPTQAASLAAANKWWETKLAELTGRPVEPARPIDMTKIASNMDKHVRAMELVQLACMSSEVADKVQPTRPLVAIVPEDKTVGAVVELWVQREKARIKAGKIGNSRADMNRICLYHFRDWIGPSASVETINGMKWEAFYHFLVGKVEAEIWQETHASRIQATARRFVRYCWEHELIGLPRNIDSTDLSFRLSKKKIEIFTDDELARIFAVVGGQSRLHFMLMLNCGMLAKDVNDLRQDQVDWTAGTITRKRSKTKDRDSVPEVSHKLWAQTFDLLKRWRSSDQEIVLLTQTGKRWILDNQGDVAWSRSDSIASCLREVMKKAKVKGKPKMFRATAATKLGDHKEYKFYAQYFLGQSPRSVADTNYVIPSKREFFEALAWLEAALGLK